MAWHDRACKRLELLWDDKGIQCSGCGSIARNRDSHAQKDLPPHPLIPVTQRSELRCVWPHKQTLSDFEATSTSDTSSVVAEIPLEAREGHIYCNLRHANEIRVLCLFGDNSFNAPIHIALDTVDLLSWSRPTYEALSYTWADDSGNSSRCERVYVGPHYDILPVTRNCEAALRRLRGQRDRMIWCDAVCINQENISERNHQVTLMPIIYSQASRTLVYLGKATELGIRVMDFLSLGSDAGEPEADIVDAVALVYNRPYFTRTWVVQEVAFSNNVTVTYGDRTIPWDCIEQGHKHLPSKQGTHSWIARNSIRTLRQISSGPAYHLFQLLKETRQCIAGDPRDKVFALLGLVQGSMKDTPALRPDYSLSTQEIYTGTTCFLLELGKERREIMGYAVCAKKIPHLPSWVPDWTSGVDLSPAIHWKFRTPSLSCSLSNVAPYLIDVKAGCPYARSAAHYLSTKEYTRLRDTITLNNAETEISRLRSEYKNLSKQWEESQSYSKRFRSDPFITYPINRQPKRGPIEILHGQYNKSYGPHPACNNPHALRWKSLFRYYPDTRNGIQVDEETLSLVVQSRPLLKICPSGEVKIGEDDSRMHYWELSENANSKPCEIHLVPSLGGLYMFKKRTDGVFSLVDRCDISIAVTTTLKQIMNSKTGREFEGFESVYNSNRTDDCDCGKINEDTNDWLCFETTFAYCNEYRLRQWDIDMGFLREKDRDKDLDQDQGRRPGVVARIAALFTDWFSGHATTKEGTRQPQLPEEAYNDDRPNSLVNIWDSLAMQVQTMQKQTIDLVGPRDLASFFLTTSSFPTDDVGGLREELYKTIEETNIKRVVRGTPAGRSVDLWTTLAEKSEQEVVAYFFEATQIVQEKLKRHGSVLEVLRRFENYNWDGLWAPSREGMLGKNRIFLCERVLPILEHSLVDQFHPRDINRVRICKWVITLDLLIDIQESLAMHTELGKLCEAAQKEVSILID